METSSTAVGSEAADAFAQGYAALQRGEAGLAASQQARFPALKARVATRPDYTRPGSVDALAKALDAAIAFQAGHQDEALVLLAEANRIEDGLPVEFGPPTIVKPTWELRGEFLLAMDRPREAKDAFTRSLALQPNRWLSVQGLAAANQALQTAGQGGR
jgi:tetratricopeptide (TPR) repeat protein